VTVVLKSRAASSGVPELISEEPSNEHAGCAGPPQVKLLGMSAGTLNLYDPSSGSGWMIAYGSEVPGSAMVSNHSTGPVPTGSSVAVWKPELAKCRVSPWCTSIEPGRNRMDSAGAPSSDRPISTS
jgi:hypothetical protein